MKVLKREQVRTLDKKAQEMGISGIVLMEHAAMALATQVNKAVKQKGKRILIVCGKGNNGGDGFALARLLNQDPSLHVTICADLSNISDDAQVFANIVQKLDIAIVAYEQVEMKDYDIIVDCLLGTGLTREVKGNYAQLIQMINDAHACVIACDIPSGLDSDDGRVHGIAVKADETVSFAVGKLGLYMNAGSMYCGSIRIADISIPRQLLDKTSGFTVLDDALIQAALPKRFAHSHKGTYGKVLVIGGRNGMSGAALLCCEGALRCGAGTVTLMSDPLTLQAAATRLPEVMHLVLSEHVSSSLFQEQLQSFDCVAIGNGLGRDAFAQKLVKEVWESSCMAIFDGDALALLKHDAALTQRSAPYILTPHPKEVSYLLGVDVQEILKKPLETLYQSERAYQNATLVLKNDVTMISDGNNRYINVIGNDSLAHGGSGDVLCGMILGLLAQNHDPLDACIGAVYVHARCGDQLIKDQSSHGILPSDILAQISKELYNLLQITV